MTDFSDRLGIAPAADDSLANDAALGLTVTDEHLNRNGTLHGGVIATLCDTTMGAAVRTVLDEDDAAATVSMTVTYLSPAAEGDELVAAAEVRRQGDKIVIAEANVARRSDDKPIAHAVATFASIG